MPAIFFLLDFLSVLKYSETLKKLLRTQECVFCDLTWKGHPLKIELGTYSEQHDTLDAEAGVSAETITWQQI